MSGECEKCGNHILECECPYTRCSECKGIFFKDDKFCINCLLEESRALIKHVDENIYHRINYADGTDENEFDCIQKGPIC